MPGTEHYSRGRLESRTIDAVCQCPEPGHMAYFGLSLPELLIHVPDTGRIMTQDAARPLKIACRGA